MTTFVLASILGIFSFDDHISVNAQELNFAQVNLDKKVYTWTDKIHITITAPSYDLDSNKTDEIGNSDEHPVKIGTRGFDLDNYKLVETGPNTGIFAGEIRLTGFSHDVDGNHRTGVDGNDITQTIPSGIGPTDGLLPSDDDDEVTVSFEYAQDKMAVDSAIIMWNIGQVKWLEDSYPATGTGVVRVIDPDMNLDPEEFDNFDVDVWSDSDVAGVDLTVTETNEATGIFEGTIFFTTSDESSGHRLRVAEGETVNVEYEDHTLPDPYTTADELDIINTSRIQGNYNPDNADDRITLDKTMYTWTDKVYVTIDSLEHNLDRNKVDEIGNTDQYPIKISTRGFDLDNYKLVETGPDTGMFAGAITLGGFRHDADGNAATGVDGNDVVDISPSGNGPRDGLLPSDNKDGVTVSFEHAEDETAIRSASIIWNEGKVQWLEDSYPATGTGVVRVIDPDMNLDPERVDDFQIDVWSDSDAGGIDLIVTETNNATGIFEGTVFFSTEEESSGHTLRVYGEDAVTAEYEDNTLPDPYTTADELDITGTSVIQKIPPSSPYKQLRSGVMIDEITCKDYLEKIFRPTGFVACVDSSSVKKLMQKGWSLKSIPVDFTGEWKNSDSRTNDIANIAVTQDDSRVTAHVWNSCDPHTFCDWGESTGTVNSNNVTFTWKIDSVTHDITITKIGNNLQMERESESSDPRWTQNKQMDFIPGTLILNK